jgi:hypothetical protein
MLDFRLGRVVSVDSTATDANGNPTPTINIQDLDDGSRLSIPLAPAAWEQHLPAVGYQVLYLRNGKHWSRIVKIWGVGAATDRKGVFALDDGEFFMQSPLGLGFIKGDRQGRVNLCSGDATATLDMSDDGVTSEAKSYRFKTQDGLTLEMTADGEILLEKRSADGKTVEVACRIDQKKNIMVEALGDVSVKATNIYLDGNVYYGPGATDAAQRSTFGDVVTGGPLGTHPVDYVTGGPILGSGTVKAAR